MKQEIIITTLLIVAAAVLVLAWSTVLGYAVLFLLESFGFIEGFSLLQAFLLGLILNAFTGDTATATLRK